MKVSGIRTAGAAKIGKAKKASASGANFNVESVEASSGSAPAQAMSAVGGIDALMAMQEVDVDGKSARRRAVQRGTDMLDILDEIQICMLEGDLPVTKLKALLRVVNGPGGACPDPAVNAVLEEVELRARVELAKFGHYG